VTMRQPPCSTSSRKYHAPMPPLSVNSSTEMAAVARDRPGEREGGEEEGGPQGVSISIETGTLFVMMS
jgi:hypothetical protein